MIVSLSIENFKSYEHADLHVSPLTILIGANASGKTNAIEAIRILSWLSKGSRLEDMAQTISGGDGLVRGQAQDLFRHNSESFTLACRFDGVPDGWNCFDLTISLLSDSLIIAGECVSNCNADDIPLYKIDSDANPHTDEVSVMYNNFKRGRNKPHVPCSNRQAIFYQLETPGRFDKIHKKSQQTIPAVTKFIRETLRHIVFLDPRPVKMRDYSFVKNSEMEEDGKNLSSVLFHICKEENGRKQKLLDFIRSLPEQDIKDVRFIKTERNDVMLKLVESFGGQDNEIPAPLLSDGTLRVLAVAATLLSAPDGSLVVIEEIDNGVHPSRAKTLVDQIKSVSQERNLRVLVTTHNPALLDALPDSALSDVLCCYRDIAGGDSKIARLGDIDRYPELVAQGTLGELVTNRVLDHFLKDKRSSADRKAEYQTFLDEYEGEVIE